MASSLGMGALGRGWVAAQSKGVKKVSVMTGNWEIPASDIDHNNCVPVGEGAFGPVYQATVSKLGGELHQSVIIKKLLDNGNAVVKKRFIREMQALKEIDNEFICRMIGVVTVEPPLLMVFECGNGLNLKTYLISNRTAAPVGPWGLAKMGLQIANAMSFLESKNVIHEDLVCFMLFISFLKRLRPRATACTFILSK